MSSKEEIKLSIEKLLELGYSLSSAAHRWLVDNDYVVHNKKIITLRESIKIIMEDSFKN